MGVTVPAGTISLLSWYLTIHPVGRRSE